MKFRDVRRSLKSQGCVAVRCAGSHEIWRAPSGRTLPPIVVNHLNADIPRGTLKNIQRGLEAEGLSLSAS